MAAVVGALRADLSIDTVAFEKDLGNAAQSIERFGDRCKAIGRSVQMAGAALTLGLTTPIIVFAREAGLAASKADQAFGKVEAKLASMGGASGRTAKDLDSSSKALRDMSTYSRADIMGGVTANLLNFQRVNGEVFDRAQRAIVNYAASSGKDLASSANAIGAALNDPLKGMKALEGAGVSLTKTQKQQIEAWVKSGDGVKAQGLLLSELERRYNGAAEAVRANDPMAAVRSSWGEFTVVIGRIVNEFLPPLTAMLSRALDAFNAMSPGMQRMAVYGAAIAAALGPVLVIGGQLISAFGAIMPLFAGMASTLQGMVAAGSLTSVAQGFRLMIGAAAPWAGIIALLVGAMWEFRSVIFDAFGSVVEFWKSTVGPAFTETFEKITSVFDGAQSGPIGGFVRFLGWALAEIAGLIIRVLGTAIGRQLTYVLRLIGTAFEFLGGVVKAVGQLLTGDFMGAFSTMRDAGERAFSGLLRAFDAIIPGFENAVKYIRSLFTRWIQNGIASVLSWVEQRFPNLVKAVRNTARGVTNMAKSLYDGFRKWTVALKPLIDWASDALSKLGDLWSKVTGRQNRASSRNTPTPAAPAAEPDTGGGGGGGDTGGGGGGASDSDFDTGGGSKSGGGSKRSARELERATDRFKDALKSMNEAVTRGLEERALPKSSSRANELRRRIADVRKEAEEAGVSVGGYAAEIDALQKRINELEQDGLAREAEEFARAVAKSGRAVNEFSRGGVPPLVAALQSVDDQYESLRAGIEKQIEENEALAESNSDAARSLVDLRAHLSALERAHLAAAQAARAQHTAQQALADLQAQRDAAAVQNKISDFKDSLGEGGSLTPQMEAVKAAERELAQERIDAAVRLQELEMQHAEAVRVGDTDAAARLVGIIALQREYFALVTETSAAQVAAAEKLKTDIESFESSLSDALTNSVENWELDLKGIMGSFKKLAMETFIRPQTDKIAGGVGNFLKGIMGNFAGGFATGGYIPPGKWGITGEQGIEAVFGGRQGKTIVPNHELSSGGARSATVNQYITTPNADSFRKSQRQVAGDMRRAINT